MKKTEFSFPSSDGKTQIHAVSWLPEEPPRAVLQISHGVGEYVLRYEPFAAYLAARGFAVTGGDHLGHGGSVGYGCPRLYFGPKGSWNCLTADLDRLRRLTQEQLSGVPYFLLGHSMGSFIARTYLIQYPGAVAKTVLMGTGYMASGVLQAGRAAAALEERRNGGDKPFPAADALAFGAYNRRFAPNRTASDWLSCSEENVDNFLADPLCGGTATAGLFREMLWGIAFNQRRENLLRMNRNMPVLLVSGGEDPVGGMGRGVEKVYRSFLRCGMRHVEMKLYPKLRHEILNETCKEQVYEDIVNWLLP